MAVLSVRMLEATGKPELLCVLCHGYGAPGDDLVPIGSHLARGLEGRVAFAFPEAPLTIPGMFGARAWWPIDIERMMRMAAAGERERLYDDVPEGMAEARKRLRETVDELARRAGLPLAKVVLGGFSQGSMITTDLALRLEEAPAALAIFSGTLLCRPEWTKLAPQRAGLTVVQSHGEDDPILPYSAALDLRTLLTGAGLTVDFTSFRGGHTIPAPAMQKLAALLTDRLGPRAST